MLSFKSFLKDYSKKYIELSLSDESQDKLRQWCLNYGFNLSKSYSGKTINPEEFHFHITIFYSDNEEYIKNGQFKIETIDIEFEKFALLGKEKNVPVLLVKKTPQLENIRTIYEEMGLRDSWGEWKPHVSLSYSYNKNKSIDKIQLPDMLLIADKIKIENQNG